MNPYLKRAVMAAADKLGYAIMPAWMLEAQPLAMHLRTLFERHKIDVVLDVGANAGQYKTFLRQRVGFEGIIHSFEPQPALAASLKEQARREERWFIHPVALGSENADLTLNVMARDTFSSFREPDNSWTAQFIHANVVAREVVVPVRRLDDLVPTLPGVAGGALYLKCDTQGFDLEVMRGGPHLMTTLKGLQFELAIQRIYQGVPGYLEMLAAVGALGFDISGFFPVASDPHGRAIELDCVMVRGAGSVGTRASE